MRPSVIRPSAALWGMPPAWPHGSICSVTVPVAPTPAPHFPEQDGGGHVLEREPRWPLELLRGSQAPRRAVCGTRGSLRTMHGGGSAPSCCVFTHRVAFEEGSGTLRPCRDPGLPTE